MKPALLLDLDGTLADSLGVMRRVYDSFLEARGCRGTGSEFEGLNGPPLEEVVERLKQLHGLAASLEDLVGAYLEAVEKAYCGVMFREGGRALLRDAAQRGYRVGIVTSNTRRVARAWLTARHFEVDALVTCEMVARGKPDPEPYLAGLRMLEADPARSIAVEDSIVGAQSAVAAGLRTYAVGGAPDGGWPEGVEWRANLAAVGAELRDVD